MYTADRVRIISTFSTYGPDFGKALCYCLCLLVRVRPRKRHTAVPLSHTFKLAARVVVLLYYGEPCGSRLLWSGISDLEEADAKGSE